MLRSERSEFMRHVLLLALACSPSVAACASSPGAPKQPPGAPPSPVTVTRANPGGDADDPEWAALDRLAREGFATKADRWKTLDVPLMDAKNWRRVTIWGHPTRVSFRYGDEHHAVLALWYTKAEGSDDPASCLERFARAARETARGYGVTVGEPTILQTSQETRGAPRDVMVQLLDGRLESLFKTDEYVGALAAYESWPGTCLLQGFAVVAGTHRDLALRVRDRWLDEGAAKLAWKVDAAPDTLSR
jgi:hypothetical protein